MTYFALVSPQGHVEYNALFVLGEGTVAKLEHGKWYTNEELGRIAEREPYFLLDSPQAVEKNIMKWRFEVQP